MAFLHFHRSCNFYRTLSQRLGTFACCFSTLENRLSLFDIFADDEDVDRNGMVLPAVNSIVSYTTQRQYRVGKYMGVKTIDGIQKLQILNEHDCIRDVGLGSLNGLLAPPATPLIDYTASDLERIRRDIDLLYRRYHLPLDRIHTKFRFYDRFNVQQVLPCLPEKLRSRYSDIALIGFIDRVLRNSGSVVEKQTNNWNKYNEYKCHPKEFLPLLKSNYEIIEKINSIFRNSSGFTARDCDQFVSRYHLLDKSDKKAVESFVKDFRVLVNSIILLSTVFQPSEDSFDNYALIRDHVLIPLFGNKDIPHIHFHTADILRELGLLEPNYPPQFLVDSKCGYSGFTPSLKKDAKFILESFLMAENSQSVSDDYARDRSLFDPVAIAVDSITTSEVDDSISVLGPSKVAVHIADPTSFILLGSELDFNASLRSVTYYYPNKVYPLYPWEIATACSLSTTQFADSNPDNRFNPNALTAVPTDPKTPLPRALTIVMEFGDDGSISDYSILCTTLKRPIRLTYEEVEAILDGYNPKANKSAFESSSSQLLQQSLLQPVAVNRPFISPHVPSNAPLLGFGEMNHNNISLDSVFGRVTSSQLKKEEIVSTLTSLYDIALKRRAYRERKGCIDFSFPEARFHVENGVADGIIQSEDHCVKSEELVMEMMVAAGETVGLLGKEEKLALPYRSHPYNMILPADQMRNRHIFFLLIPCSLIALLTSPVHYPSVVHNWEQLVRCLPARISRDAQPHSGLGIDAYVQVTSPLRRYNDCLVHRQLKAVMAKQPLPYNEEDIFRIGSHCFQMEKRSTKFEDGWNRYIIMQRMKDLLKTNGSLQLNATVLDISVRGMNSVICGVVLNDLGLRFNVNSASIPRKGELIKVDILDVVPDCLRIKAVLSGEWRVEDDLDYVKVL